MPLNAFGWTDDEDEKLAELVEPNTHLYNHYNPSRKNILVRESTWQEIAQALSKPVEECKKRWRGLRDGYLRSKRVGALHKKKLGIFEKLKFLESSESDDLLKLLTCPNDSKLQFFNESGDTISMTQQLVKMDKNENQRKDDNFTTEQQVITDNQEYYEITLVDPLQEQHTEPILKILPPKVEVDSDEPPKKVRRKNVGRKKILPTPRDIPPVKILPKPFVVNGPKTKKILPMPRDNPPVKILPKPFIVNGPKIIRYVKEPKTPEQRAEIIDQLVERILKESTNEIDVFFKSMAASVKKLQPSLIPKVKMEVCNVIAKYEMQSFDKNQQNY